MIIIKIHDCSIHSVTSVLFNLTSSLPPSLSSPVIFLSNYFHLHGNLTSNYISSVTFVCHTVCFFFHVLIKFHLCMYVLIVNRVYAM